MKTVNDMITDMETSIKLTPLVTEFILRGRKRSISPVSYYNLISKCLKL